MAIEIVMPKLGWTMEEGVLAEWAKHDGDAVHVGDVLFTVESDKALNEVESFENGILRLPPDSPPPGTTVRVGALLGYIVQPGERAPFEAHTLEQAPAEVARTPVEAATTPLVAAGRAAVLAEPSLAATAPRRSAARLPAAPGRGLRSCCPSRGWRRRAAPPT